MVARNKRKQEIVTVWSMEAVWDPENDIFQDLTAFLYPFIISMKYGENIKAVKEAFFKTSVYLKFNMKYGGSIKSW